ncbi:MAG: hypothetical protein ACF8NJ_06570 [Phycisphaerales bacterium JB038]
MPERNPDDSLQEKEHLELIRREVIDGASRLANLAIKLRKPPPQLDHAEQAVVASLLDHQKHYAMSMLFGAYNALLVYERASRAAVAKGGDSGSVPAPIDNELLGEYQNFCDAAISNYYGFVLRDQSPEIAIPSNRVIESFAGVTLPRRTPTGAGSGPKKLVFRDFDHPGHLILYAANLLRVDGKENAFDCVINPLFGAIEIGFALRAIYGFLGLNKIRDVELIRFSRDDENESLMLHQHELTHFLPTFLEDDFLERVRAAKRVLMIDDGVASGLTIAVLRWYFESRLGRDVLISAVEEDLDRRPIDGKRVIVQQIVGLGQYQSSNQETLIQPDELEIPAIAQRSIIPIPFVIADALEIDRPLEEEGVSDAAHADS